MTTDRIHRRLYRLLASVSSATILLPAVAPPAHALEHRLFDAIPRIRVRTEAQTAVEEADHEPGVFERLRERLRSIPLRPVSIGTTPRRPTDPEPGVGVVIRIPF